MENDIKMHGYIDEAKGTASLAATTGYALEDTTIEKGGVVRCCLGSVATEYLGQRVMLGAKSKCPHCGTTFTLVEIKPGMRTCYQQPVKWPVWKPDWQLKEHNEKVSESGDENQKPL